MTVTTLQRIFPGLNLVGYPNRDSVGFRDFYRIPGAHTVFRGTLRYTGFPEITRSLVDIGYFSQEQVPALEAEATPRLTWAQLTAQLLGLPTSTSAAELQDPWRTRCPLSL
ncbi:hypothetical protein BBP40_000736 [Aspergillus hancockii]|nr:hypothetical protein BBP40_000736 [Aspergillus hancockii]